jgi:hypothetical protein
MAFDLTWEPRGVYRRYWADVTIAERRESFETIFADPRFDDLMFTITDYLDVRHYEVTDEATEEIAALHVGATHTNPRLRIAAVVTNPLIIRAIEHFIALEMVPTPYRVFATVSDARAWIAQTPVAPTPRWPGSVEPWP